MYDKHIKRLADIIISMVMIILFLPVMLIAALFIKMFDKGPVLFVQNRTGLNGKNFSIFKFRTMKVGTCDVNGKLLNHCERLTKTGKFLRKTSIDELPQLFNILRGEMSFVGPRPWIPEYYETFNEKQKQRVKVLPGISGLAQAKGRNGIGIMKKIEYDLEYVNNISFKRDLKIFLMTIAIVFKRQHAEIIQEGIQEELDTLRKENNKI